MKQLPNQNETITKDGKLNEQTRLYLLQLGDLLAGNIQQAFPVYADLAAIQAKIKTPEAGKEYGFVTGQGKCAYNGTDFVLSSDYTTVIT